MLFSRMVAGRNPVSRENPRNRVMARTATGIDADTVIPTLRTRYRDEAAKISPRQVPVTTAETVNSRGAFSGGTNGSNPGGVGSVAVAMSGVRGRRGGPRG